MLLRNVWITQLTSNSTSCVGDSAGESEGLIYFNANDPSRGIRLSNRASLVWLTSNIQLSFLTEEETESVNLGLLLQDTVARKRVRSVQCPQQGVQENASPSNSKVERLIPI